MPPPEKSSPYQLVVEGSDDAHTVIHLLKRHNYDWDDATRKRPRVTSAGGVPQLLARLPQFMIGPFEAVGVVVDADEKPEDRWRAVRDRCALAGVDLPPEPEPEGTVVQAADKRVGVWLMPDNSLPGSLEDFLAKLVPPNDACWQRARQAVADAHANNCAQNTSRLKHELHTYLAWHAERPGMPFGTALTAEVLGRDSSEAQLFVAWFQRLFGD